MATRYLFISYKRGPLTTPIAERLYDRIRVQLGDIPVEPFFDTKSVEAGEQWEPKIDAFISKADFFVAFVSIDFWLSTQCMRELRLAVARYEDELRREPEFESDPKPKLLFVLADQVGPTDLAFDASAAAGRGDEKAIDAAGNQVRRIKNLGEINFLGPYDAGASLVRLPVENFVASDIHLAAMIPKIRKLAERR